MKFKLNKYALLCIIATVLCIRAQGQFYNAGNEPASIKWSRITTQSYNVIYPRGLDSLAWEYATELERVKKPVSGSLGFVPNESYGTPLPVILHPYSVRANGFVSWCPRRMELYTVPDYYAPEPLQWIRQLSIHESRHAAQMQPYAEGKLKFLRMIVGDISPGLLCGMLGGPSAMEGDAVVAETALTQSGRGRSADFLEYMRACFNDGEFRNYYQWRYGSIKNYCPDYYKIGYVMAAGMREYCGFGDWPFFSMTKRFNRSFPAISDTLATVWRREADSRAPFMPCGSVTKPENRFIEYTSLCPYGVNIIARRNGIQEAATIGRISPSTGWIKLGSSAASASRIKCNPDSGILYWSEDRSSHRWDMISYSEIRSLNLYTGSIKNLTRKTRYFNPSVSEDGKLLAVSQSLENGESAVMVLDAASGRDLYSYPAPKELQVLETTWLNDNIYASALGPDGIGIYFVSTFQAVLEPQPAKIKEIDTHDGRIVFVSDRNGVNELYALYPETGKVMQITSSRQGSSDHIFLKDSLYYTSLEPKGRMILRTAVKDLAEKEVSYSDLHSYVMADSLSNAEPLRIEGDPDTSEWEIKPYSRLGHSLRFHSWLPFYGNTDIIESLSVSGLMTYCGLGVSGYFQNDLSTLQGFAGYSAWTPAGGWANAGHLRLTYSGLVPVFEVSSDISDEGAYTTAVILDEENKKYGFESSLNSPVSVNFKLRTYVPLDFSSNGWSRGIIPQARWTFSNDLIDFDGISNCNNSLSASIRAYSVRNTSYSNMYPRWGIGVEGGYCTRPGLRNLLVDNMYGYAYAYVPGILKTHGIKLSALCERNLGNAVMVSPFANVAPRGGSSLASELAKYRRHGRFTIDYAMPFAPVDWSFFSPFTYVRNFELITHYDLAYYVSSKSGSGSESSVGADIVAKLGNVLSLPFDTRIGVSCCYLFGDLEVKPFYVGMVFSVDI